MNLSIESDGTYSRSIITPNLGQLQLKPHLYTWNSITQSSIVLMENGMLLGESFGKQLCLRTKAQTQTQTDYNNSDYDWLFHATNLQIGESITYIQLSQVLSPQSCKCSESR